MPVEAACRPLGVVEELLEAAVEEVATNVAAEAAQTQMIRRLMTLPIPLRRTRQIVATVVTVMIPRARRMMMARALVAVRVAARRILRRRPLTAMRMTRHQSLVVGLHVGGVDADVEGDVTKLLVASLRYVRCD